MRAALRGLDPRNAERIAGHLVTAGTLVDEDPDLALAHARAARDRASRLAVVREAVGVAAYHAGDYAEAARELRAYRRMSGDPGYRAVLADCERALGRPEVALRLVAEALAQHPDDEETAELRLVEAGARRDLGETSAARLVLEEALGGRPNPDQLRPDDPARLRLAAAYADLLAAEGRQAEADAWVEAVAVADPEGLTGALDRPGVEFTEIEDQTDDQTGDRTDDRTDDQETAEGHGPVTGGARTGTHPEEDAEDGGGAPLPGTSPAATAPTADAETADADTAAGDLTPASDADLGEDFREDVEAEVAELLGEGPGSSDRADEAGGGAG